MTDVIKSNGTGSINVLKDITASQLESLRLSNNGHIVFGVDINEASDGTEKATTQGIAIESAQLLLTIAGIEYVYTEFSTLTRTIVAKTPSTTREEYYTLIGESGSSRVSSSNDIQTAFDATLSIAIDIDLSSATSAVLNIILLDTNTDLGDPEAFYDYSNGFEDVAILNATDASFINNYRAGHDEAPVLITDSPADPAQTVTSWVYYPASGENYIVAYEDLFPSTGDYDFNDLSVAFHVEYGFNRYNQVIKISGEAFLISRGAMYDHNWYLRIPLPATASGTIRSMHHDYYQINGRQLETVFTGDLILQGFENTLLSFIDPDKSMVNTFVNSNFIKGPRFAFTVSLDTPLDASDIGAAPFDPYLYVHDTGYEIHLMDIAPTPGSKNTLDNQVIFKDENGFPFAMVLPDNWKPPYAGINIKTAYPEFSEFINNHGQTMKNWHTFPHTPSVFPVTAGDWKW